MATAYPGAIDNFTNPTPADQLSTPAVLHTDQHSDLNDAVEALETKVGEDGSADPTSQDYQLNHPGVFISSDAGNVLTVGSDDKLLVAGPKVFAARIDQSGTSAPTFVDILQNDLGGTPVWSYLAPGTYVMTLAGAFPNDKTFPYAIDRGFYNATTGLAWWLVYGGPDDVYLITGQYHIPFDGSVDLANNQLFACIIKLEVYS